ncbi:hypothetical protein SAY87_003050 [Trapa incisa]|uniref:Uncharacterized protein n=1 Tax=Trapa incisa TaxID=236973 RepID=A0AAN7KMQ9_9MYRT|nr:hypothetical protein SAY87_003050 [Trapa incisa]
MARIRSCWSYSRTAAIIWAISLLIFYCLFRLALRNSSRNTDPITEASGFPVSNNERRSRLYDKMARDLDDHGAAFLKHGETSQSLSISDLFTVGTGFVRPVLKAANPPVRANVLYLATKYSEPITKAVQEIFQPLFDKGKLSHCCSYAGLLLKCYILHLIVLSCLLASLLAIWFQNSSLYHFSMFHASHHITPVPASNAEIEAEAIAVKAVAESICPLKIVLDSVVLTSTGVLLGCWQVKSGTDPVSIRSKLRAALPRAPEKQLYDAAMLHTSFARFLGQPRSSSMNLHEGSDQLQSFHQLVGHLNNKLGGFEAQVTELWYVEEYDVLALALNGRMKARRFNLGCKDKS